MLRGHIVLLIAIYPSDGDVKPGGPFGAFRGEEKAISRRTRFHFLPFFHHHHHHPTLHKAISLHKHTYSHPNLNFLQYTVQILVPQVMWSAQAVRESKIDHTKALYPPSADPEARNSAMGWR